MNELIEILNEYEKSSYEKDTNWVYEGDEWEYYEQNNWIIKGNWENEEVLTQYELCSKQFGFIKRLVDNDKINEKKVFHFLDNSELYEDALCNLALSDTPIEDLISYLK